MERYDVEIAGLPSDPGEVPEYVWEVAEALARLVDPEREIVWRNDDVASDAVVWRAESEASTGIHFHYSYDDDHVWYALALQADYVDGDVADLEWEVLVWVEPLLPPMPERPKAEATIMQVIFVAAVAAGGGAAFYLSRSLLLAFVVGVLAVIVSLWLGFRYLAHVNRPWREQCDRLRSELDEGLVERFQRQVLDAIREHPMISLTYD